MPSKTKKVKAAGRLGVRYGRSVRTKVANLEEKQRKKANHSPKSTLRKENRTQRNDLCC